MPKQIPDPRFERPDPLPIVENWERLGKEYFQERAFLLESQAVNEIDDPRAPTRTKDNVYILSPVLIAPAWLDCRLCFETAISNPKICERYKDRAKIVEPEPDPLGEREVDYALHEQKARFRLFQSYYFEWWIRTYMYDPIFVHDRLNDGLERTVGLSLIHI